MTTLLRVLHLDTNPQDTDRIQTLLTDGASCAIRRVETRCALLAEQ